MTQATSKTSAKVARKAASKQVARSALAHLQEELPLNWNKWIRWIHRWLSIAFTVAVIVNVVALKQGEPAIWVGLLALFPLALLLLTGLYLFVLPHATKWRSG
jgi:heme A synthase